LIQFLQGSGPLPVSFPDDVLVSLFVDDLAALVQKEEKTKAEAKAQEALDILAAWSQESRSVLASTEKV